MKKFMLMLGVAVLAFGASESWAATCTWEDEAHTKLTITGSGTETFTSCSNGINHKSATEVTFKEGITSIGRDAFYEANSLQSVNMPNVETIGYAAFQYATSLQRVDMPKVTEIAWNVFYGATALQSVDMPNVTSIGAYAFRDASSLTNIIITDDVNVDYWRGDAFDSAFTDNENSIITCLGDVNTCKDKLSKYGSKMQNKVQSATAEQCNSSVNYYYSTNNGCVKLPSAQETCEGAEFYWVNNTCTKLTPTAYCANRGELLQGKECVASCGSSFRLNDGECDRIRYTPAEVAKVLRDDDTNVVTITFKHK